jgi:hypothetical protein
MLINNTSFRKGIWRGLWLALTLPGAHAFLQTTGDGENG